MQEALSDCNEALRLAPDEAETLDSRGLVYLKLGRFDLAIADYDAALKVNPKLAGSLYGRGVAKLKKGATDSGNADITGARALQANIVEEFSGYGIKLDEPRRAMPKLGQAADIITQHPVALQLRTLQTMAEIATEKNSTIIFPAQFTTTVQEALAIVTKDSESK